MSFLIRILYLLGSAFVGLTLFFLVQTKLVRLGARSAEAEAAYRRSR